MPALQHAFDHFSPTTPGCRITTPRRGRMSRSASGTRRNLLGYELLNEPWPGTSWQDCVNPTGCPANDAKLEAFDKRVLGAIRAVDPRGLVWHEPFVLFNQGAGTMVKALGDANVGFSFHDYCLAAEQPRFRTGLREVRRPRLPARAGPRRVDQGGAAADRVRRHRRRLGAGADAAARRPHDGLLESSGTTAAAATRRPPAPATSRRSCSTRPSRRLAPTSRRSRSTSSCGRIRRSLPGRRSPGPTRTAR